MDDILFRHTAIATPNDKSEEFLERAMSSDSSKKLVDDGKAFDKLLKDSLKVDVPDDLADKIMLEQSFALERDKNISARWHIAIAASVAFVIGLSIPLIQKTVTPPVEVAAVEQAPESIGNVALEMVKNEYFLTAKANENASLQAVNAKLAVYGGQAKEGLGEIMFVNYCSFKGTSALHMILKGEKGRVTVFVVPEKGKFTPAAEFSNEHLKGMSEKMGKANIVIVGEPDEPLEMMQEKLHDSIKWDI
ncbi:DUF3379 family protein [Psychromonas sp. 14N.309.X.WAT.B.A12]|uniref:DUF3379 family protein n=1 Tax=unclassified Psychromonas TaxID=2614957 RepID=UPI0025B16B1E|nr:DUF3379 family protein [Psychromonas sp. 14N.309.X.WAT.B.A12]MDN2662568.1 DUF3379 family protein [Psychromonas sp. 14N.309.X.WAT.B.A12]